MEKAKEPQINPELLEGPSLQTAWDKAKREEAVAKRIAKSKEKLLGEAKAAEESARKYVESVQGELDKANKKFEEATALSFKLHAKIAKADVSKKPASIDELLRPLADSLKQFGVLERVAPHLQNVIAELQCCDTIARESQAAASATSIAGAIGAAQQAHQEASNIEENGSMESVDTMVRALAAAAAEDAGGGGAGTDAEAVPNGEAATKKFFAKLVSGAGGNS